MDNVIKFPAKSVRDWAIIERALLDELSKNRFPLEVQERLLTLMKSFYETLNVNFNFVVTTEFPSSLSVDDVFGLCTSIGQRVAQTNGELIQSFTKRLFFERLGREISICRELRLI